MPASSSMTARAAGRGLSPSLAIVACSVPMARTARGGGLLIIAIGIAWPFILAVCVGIEESAVARTQPQAHDLQRRNTNVDVQTSWRGGRVLSSLSATPVLAQAVVQEPQLSHLQA